MIKTAICGATGYTGLEILKLLLKHPEVEITSLTAKIEKTSMISEIFPEFNGFCDMVCDNELDIDKIVSSGAEIVFLALPHIVSMLYAEKFIKKGIKVIDLSADFRLKDLSVYKKYYGTAHKSPELVKSAVYGLPELYLKDIKDAELIANPGCYPTASILACAPLFKNMKVSDFGIIIDAKTGVTGAGRKPSLTLLFPEVNENVRAYKIGIHQHTPEISQELGYLCSKKVNVLFTPHLVPINRGILSTVYLPLIEQISLPELVCMYKDFYNGMPFVKVYDEGVLPEIKEAAGTNNCLIGLALSEDRSKAVIISVIDNLLKGAGGQAVQNMNIMCGFNQSLGLM